jgi:hypothetical protein
MKALFCVLATFCVCGWADETGDRRAIVNAVAALNEFPHQADLLTSDADGTDIPDQLRKGKRLEFRMRSSPSDHPTVVISHEPWGEAMIKLPGTSVAVEMLNPRIESSTVRFITPEVALAEGAWTYKAATGKTETTPLLFVLKKVADRWKIASIRVLR